MPGPEGIRPPWPEALIGRLRLTRPHCSPRGRAFVGIRSPMMALAAAGSRAASLVLVYAVIAVVWGADAFIGPDTAGRAIDRARNGLPIFAAIACALFTRPVTRVTQVALRRRRRRRRRRSGHRLRFRNSSRTRTRMASLSAPDVNRRRLPRGWSGQPPRTTRQSGSRCRLPAFAGWHRRLGDDPPNHHRHARTWCLRSWTVPA